MRVVDTIEDRCTHVWRVDMDDCAWDALAEVVPPDEVERAGRFRTATLQKHFLRCRSALRRLLARYLGQDPADITFSYGRFGKPVLPGQTWHFNLSHSNNVALIAVSSQPVGVDLEYIEEPHIAVEGLIELVCHPDEKAVLHALTPRERRIAFYKLWTQKEAYCKALGIGLQQTLSTLRFQGHASLPVSEVVDETRRDGDSYFVRYISSIPGYAACVCTPSFDHRIYLRDAFPQL